MSEDAGSNPYCVELSAEWVKSKCSNCGQQHPIFKVFYRGDLLFEIKDGEANYCPKCGAKMKYAE